MLFWFSSGILRVKVLPAKIDRNESGRRLGENWEKTLQKLGMTDNE